MNGSTRQLLLERLKDRAEQAGDIRFPLLAERKYSATSAGLSSGEAWTRSWMASNRKLSAALRCFVTIHQVGTNEDIGTRR